MTFAIKPTPAAHRPRGFTLLELLLVIGIIALLAGILLPAVTKTYARALALRTQADLQAISSALDMYKADFGSYPPITSANSGSAVLGKALLGPYGAAHFVLAKPHALDTARTPALPIWSATNTYQPGDVVLNGAAMDYYSYATATTGAGAAAIPNIYVCIRPDTLGQPSAGPSGNLFAAPSDFWWTRFVPYDGQDGNGSRIRLAANPDVDNLPLEAAGKVYGPYLDPERFKTNGPTILDRYGSPILYFTVDKTADPAVGTASATVPVAGTSAAPAAGWSNTLAYPPAQYTRAMVNLSDNLGAFMNATVTPTETIQPAATRIRVMLGDYATDGVLNAAGMSGETTPPQVPFLLWTAGPDKVFGPHGQGLSAGGAWTKSDVFMTSTNPTENQAAAAACDDVTNFRQ